MAKMKKKAFPKTSKIVSTKDDLGMDVDVKFKIWTDPSRRTLLRLIQGTVSYEEMSEMSPEEQNTLAHEYFEAVHNFILDCELEGIDFSTPETTAEAFDNDDLPWGFMTEVIVHLTVWLVDKHDIIKKALGLLDEGESSGKDKKPKASKSQTQSKKAS